MKTLPIVILALVGYVYCEEVKGSAGTYSYDNDSELSQTNKEEGFYDVKESNNLYKGYGEGLNTDEVTVNSHHSVVGNPNGQFYQYTKNSPQFANLARIPQSNYGALHQMITSKTSKPIYVSPEMYQENPGFTGANYIGSNQFNTNFPQFAKSYYGTSNQMITPKTAKPFVVSSEMYAGQHESTGVNNIAYGSNGYGSNQYKIAGQYKYNPAAWVGISNGMTSGSVANGLDTVNKYSPHITGYRSDFANNKGLETVREYNPVRAGYGAGFANGYSLGKNDASSSFGSSSYRTPTPISYVTENAGTGFKYSNVAQPERHFKQEYKSALVNGYGNGLGNGEMVNYYKSHGYNQPQFGHSFQYEPQTANGYGTYSPYIPSFKSSMRDIVKMVSDEQRKSNGKTIFLIGKSQIPLQMLTNMNNVNAFAGYKY